MKPKNYKKLIDLIMNFANERDAEKQHGLLDQIFSDAFMLGFLFRVPAKEGGPGAATVGQYHTALLKRLDETANYGVLTAPLSGTIYCSEVKTSNDTSGAIMRLSNHDSENLFSLFAMLMFIQGFKGVRTCPGCGNLFVIKKHTAQKSCSNRCRQRLFQAAKSDDKKEAEKKERKAAYKDKILNGGNK